MRLARREQGGDVGNVLALNKRVLVPSDCIVLWFKQFFIDHLFLQLKVPSLTLASGMHWSTAAPLAVLIKLAFLREAADTLYTTCLYVTDYSVIENRTCNYTVITL